MYLVAQSARLIPGATITIDGPEAQHAVKVARLRIGERVKVTNGHGTIATVEATDVASHQAVATVIDTEHHAALSPPVWLVQALAKGGRDEQAVEQAIELGVSRIIPWQAERSVSVWRDEGKKEKGRERWARIVTEAAKQSLQPYLATVDALFSTDDVCTLPGESSLIALDPDSSQQLSDLVVTLPADRPIALVVGPEGGISEAEMEHLVGAGAMTARLGPTVLRTSTAGPVAVALTMASRGMWSRPANPHPHFVD
jgi:16S rRNA (uracil1498-N3)-methyltransferase